MRGVAGRAVKTLGVRLRTVAPYFRRPSLLTLRIEDFDLLSDDESLEYVLANGCGLVRFGNSELAYLVGHDIRTQRQNQRLRMLLNNALREYREEGPVGTRVLLGMPIDMTVGADCFQRGGNQKLWRGTPKYALLPNVGTKVPYGTGHFLRFKEVISEVPFRDYVKSALSLMTTDQTLYIAPLDRIQQAQQFVPIHHTLEIPPQNAFELFDQILAKVLQVSLRQPSITVLVTAGATGSALSYELNKKFVRTLDVGQAFRHLGETFNTVDKTS